MIHINKQGLREGRPHHMDNCNTVFHAALFVRAPGIRESQAEGKRTRVSDLDFILNLVRMAIENAADGGRTKVIVRVNKRFIDLVHIALNDHLFHTQRQPAIWDIIRSYGKLEISW